MASELQTIEVDVKTFFADLATSAGKFCSAFVKLFKKAPTALQTVDNFVVEVAPMIEAAVALADPAVEPLVAAGLSTAETALAAIQAAAANASSGTSLLANLQNFAASVPSLLTGIDVKNTALQAKVTAIVNLVVGECKVLIPAVESWVAKLAAAPAQ